MKENRLEQSKDFVSNPLKEGLRVVLVSFVLGVIFSLSRLFGVDGLSIDKMTILVFFGTVFVVSFIGFSYAFLGVKFGRRKSEKIIKISIATIVVGGLSVVYVFNNLLWK